MENHPSQRFTQRQSFPVTQSVVFKFFIEERREIDKLKWIESEKVGHDIGLTLAHRIWWENHRNGWVSGYWQNFINL